MGNHTAADTRTVSRIVSARDIREYLGCPRRRRQGSAAWGVAPLRSAPREALEECGSSHNDRTNDTPASVKEQQNRCAPRPTRSAFRAMRPESAKETAMAWPQVWPRVEVFHEVQVAPVGPPFLHFPVDRLVRPVGQH